MEESFRKLVVWQGAVKMTVAVYRATEAFPKAEMYGLTSQLRRASVSVASNIAEGSGRGSPGEYRQFLGFARGSNREVQTQIVISRALAFGTSPGLLEAERCSLEVGRMLAAMMRKQQQRKMA